MPRAGCIPASAGAPVSQAGCVPASLGAGKLPPSTERTHDTWGSVPTLRASTPPKCPSRWLAYSFRLAEPAAVGCTGSCPSLLHLKSPIISCWARKRRRKVAEGPAGLVHAFLRHVLQEGGAPTWLRLMRAAGLEPAELPIVPAAAPWVCGRAAEKEERRRLKRDSPTIYLVYAPD